MARVMMKLSPRCLAACLPAVQLVAYNTAFVSGATAGAALSTGVAAHVCKESAGTAAMQVAAAFLCEGFQQVVHNKFCNWLFRCGCTWEWAGGWNKCNVRNAFGPKCPWCVARLSISWTTDCLPLVFMLLVFSEAKARRSPFWVQLLLPIFSFLLLGTLVAFCFKLASGYPYFIGGPVRGKDIMTDSNHETS
ncbi:unnamed protein product [Cladocopium goreaui]|uniref:Uncharacterized protein n=1 Tax=Cladocopium goreaui TaxID=2562237 RepID=A0A9P1GPM4_9DINO|nr:unnamed protein product [Cladocopium goreaui]